VASVLLMALTGCVPMNTSLSFIERNETDMGIFVCHVMRHTTDV
jgi:hypothetical protein